MQKILFIVIGFLGLVLFIEVGFLFVIKQSASPSFCPTVPVSFAPSSSPSANLTERNIQQIYKDIVEGKTDVLPLSHLVNTYQGKIISLKKGKGVVQSFNFPYDLWLKLEGEQGNTKAMVFNQKQIDAMQKSGFKDIDELKVGDTVQVVLTYALITKDKSTGRNGILNQTKQRRLIPAQKQKDLPDCETWKVLLSLPLCLLRQDDRLRDLLHRLARVHGHFLDLAERLRLGQVLRIHQNAFGAVNNLARLQRLGQITHLLLQFAKFLKAGERDINRRTDLLFAERLDQIAYHPRFFRAVYQVALALRGEQQHRRDPFLRQNLRRVNAVHLRHLDVHDHNVGLEFARRIDRALSIARLAHDEIAQRRQRFAQVRANDRLVVRDNHSSSFHASPPRGIFGNRTIADTP